MTVLSKMSSIQIEEDLCTTWVKYYTTNPTLMKYRLVDLKCICKKLKLKVTGNKSVLNARIVGKFLLDKSACDIQKHARRIFATKYISYHGPATFNKKCTNDTDFLTLEPINILHIKDFFSFTDTDGFTFGFDYNSIYNLVKRDKHPKNPYNRSTIPISVIREVKRIRRMNRILYPTNEPVANTLLPNPHIVENASPTQSHMLLSIEERRTNKTLKQRSQSLFYDIDLLGNYTSTSWFDDLTIVELTNFIEFLYQLWSYRARISFETKSNICPYYNPFTYKGVLNLVNDRNIDKVRNGVLSICENMIYTAINDEYKKLSAIYILTSLTTVSTGAREGIPWLYESTI